MTYYTLALVEENKTLNTVAKDRAEAFAQFAKELGHDITDADNGSVAPYLLDEWNHGPHWTNPTIPVFKK